MGYFTKNNLPRGFQVELIKETKLVGVLLTSYLKKESNTNSNFDKVINKL